MHQECPYCGAQMSDLDQFCTKCGLGTQAYLPLADQKAPRKKKFRWWMIPLIVFFLAIMLAILLWPRVSFCLMPEMMLVEALSNTGEDISSRVEESPLSLLLQSAQWEDGFNASMTMDLSVVGYDGFGVGVSSAWDPDSGVFMDATQQKIFGKVRTDTSWTDENRVVFSCPSGSEQEYCSAAFDGLPEALQDGIFADMDEDDRAAFSAALEAVRPSQDAFNRSELNKRYIRVLNDLLGNCRRSVEFSDKVLMNNRREQLRIISYTTENEVLAGALEEFAGIMDAETVPGGNLIPKKALEALALIEKTQEGSGSLSENLRKEAQSLRGDGTGEVSISFYLYEKKLAQMRVTRRSLDAVVSYVNIDLGTDGPYADIQVNTKDSSGKQKSWLLQTEYTDSIRRNTLTVTEAGTTQILTLDWQKDSGQLGISVTADGCTTHSEALLTGGDDGFMLTLPDALSLLSADAFGGLKFVQSLARVDMTIVVSKGGYVQIPEGKPLEQWDWDDLKYIQKTFLQ